MSIILIDDEGNLVIWQGGALEVGRTSDLEPHEPWALWLVADSTQDDTRCLIKGSEADIKRLRGCLIDELVAFGKQPHVVLDLPRLLHFGREETTT